MINTCEEKPQEQREVPKVKPIMNLGFIKAKTLEKNPNATTMVVDGEKMPIKKLKY